MKSNEAKIADVFAIGLRIWIFLIWGLCSFFSIKMAANGVLSWTDAIMTTVVAVLIFLASGVGIASMLKDNSDSYRSRDY